MRARTAIVLVVAAGVVAGCSSGSSKGSATATSGPSGSPLKLAVIVDPPGAGQGLPTSGLVGAGVTAAAKAINARGGVNGRPIKIITCDTMGNPNGAAACARSAVQDGAVASVASATSFGANVLPILSAAHVASIGLFATSQADLTAGDGFSFAPAAVTVVPGEPNLAASLGARRISLVVEVVPQTTQLVQLAGLGLVKYRLKLANTVQVPTGAPDMSTYAAAAMRNNAEAICVVLPPSDGLNFIKAVRTAGFTGKIISDATTMMRDIHSGFAATVDGVYAVDEFRPASQTSNAGVRSMVNEIRQSGYPGVIDLTVEDAWASVHLFAQVANKLPAVSAQAVLSAMPTIKRFDIGIMPPVNFSEPIPMPGLHVFNPYVFYEQVKSSGLVPVTDKFSDFFPHGSG